MKGPLLVCSSSYGYFRSIDHHSLRSNKFSNKKVSIVIRHARMEGRMEEFMSIKERSRNADDVKQEEAAKHPEVHVNSGPGPRSTSKISDKPNPNQKDKNRQNVR